MPCNFHGQPVQNLILIERMVILQFCEEKGGYLTEIMSKTKQTNINALLNSDLAYWIGLSDVAMEEKFVWQHSSCPLGDYTNWGRNEPDGGRGENCVILWPLYNWGWADISCGYLSIGGRDVHAICQN